MALIDMVQIDGVWMTREEYDIWIALKIKRGMAAKKAWETRRKNELAQKRQAAAYKAWDTRRKNELISNL